MAFFPARGSFIPPIIAHRGASAHAPENTLAAFQYAKRLGLNWVEFDVMLAATGEAVVIHDNQLSRTTNGSGTVIKSAYSYLKTLDAGGWFNPIYSHETIPCLEEVLTLLHSQKLAANLEIKPLPGYESAIVQRVLEILQAQAAHLPSPLLLSSFSPLVLQIIRKMSSSLLLGMLMDEWQPDWQDFCAEVQCVSVNVNHRLLNFARVKEIKTKGYLLLAYTVNDIQRAQELLAWGVDALFSDCPPAMLAGFKLQGANHGN